MKNFLLCVVFCWAALWVDASTNGTWSAHGGSGTWIATDDGGGEFILNIYGSIYAGADLSLCIKSASGDAAADDIKAYASGPGTLNMGSNTVGVGASVTIYFGALTASNVYTEVPLTVSAPPSLYKKNYLFVNRTQSAITVQMWQDGANYSGDYEVPSGNTSVYAFSSTSETVVDVKRVVPVVTYTGASFIAGGEGVTTILRSDIPQSYDEGDVVDQITIYVDGPADVLSNDLKSVWALTDTGALNANVYREGVDKLIASNAASGSSALPTGAATSAEQVVQSLYLENLDTNLAALRASDVSREIREEAEHDVWITAKAAAEAADSTRAGLGTSAKASAQAAFGTAPVTSGYSLASGTIPTLTVTLPVTFGGAVFDFNPFTEARLGAVASWFRQACHWLAVVTFGVWIWMQIGTWTRGINQARQAQGNAIAGGTGAQATALTAAGLLTAAILGGLVLLVAFSFDSLNLASVMVQLGTNPLTGMLAGSYWMLDQLLPIGTLITCLLARVAFSFSASSIYVGVATLARFFVP